MTGTLRTEPPERGSRCSPTPATRPPTGVAGRIAGRRRPAAARRVPLADREGGIRTGGSGPAASGRLRRRRAPACRSTSSWCPPGRSLPAWCAWLAAAYQVWLFGFDAAPVALEPFFIDRFEVTNREFREFVERGGYAERQSTGSTTAGAPERRCRFPRPDRATRPGDAGSWGPIRDGEDDLPVRGVSWYEAAAYCRVPGQESAHGLPLGPRRLRPHRAAAADLGRDHPGEQSRRRRAGAGRAATGAWAPTAPTTWRATSRSGPRTRRSTAARYLLGGAWNEPGYLFSDPDAQSPTSREPNLRAPLHGARGRDPMPERLAATGGRRPLRSAGTTSRCPTRCSRASSQRRSYTAGPLDATVDAPRREPRGLDRRDRELRCRLRRRAGPGLSPPAEERVAAVPDGGFWPGECISRSRRATT